MQVIGDCLTLHKIAQSLRAARHASGAVRLDNVRMAFGLDKDGNPVSCGQYLQQVRLLVCTCALVSGCLVCGCGPACNQVSRHHRTGLVLDFQMSDLCLQLLSYTFHWLCLNASLVARLL